MTFSKSLIDVLAGRKPKRRPIWLMRQAGRYLPEYREVRAKAGSFLALCYSPELACEVTLQPLRRFDLDAAILFSDILVVPQAMGLKLDFREGEGPLLETVRDGSGVAGLKAHGSFEVFDRVAETVGRVGAELGDGKALIGFCGAPWTVASYMIEGGSSDRGIAKEIAEAGPQWFADMMQKLVDVSIIYLKQQVAAGAEVLQVFDSWAGDLPVHLRQRWVVEPISAIVAGVKADYADVPVIVFARGVGMAHGEVAIATNAAAVGVEQDCGLGDVIKLLPKDVAVQGNLDPQALLGPVEVLVRQVQDICRSVPMERHVFNLGHGITPQAKPEAVTSLVAAVREYDRV